jgi:hypothetical protein
MSSSPLTTVAVMATYPARRNELPIAVESIVRQVDRLFVVLNEFTFVPDWLRSYDNVSPLVPDRDLKDEGKFACEIHPASYVVLLDDDLIYPPDYVSVLRGAHDKYQDLDAIVGLHGVIYPEFWDGTHRSRLVYTFRLGRDSDALVNQLGTGTVLLRGRQLPPLSYMADSAGFVDVRFAHYAWENGRPLVCVQRDGEWLRQIHVDESLFASVTQKWNPEVLREVIEFGGLSKLGRFSRAFHGVN